MDGHLVDCGHHVGGIHLLRGGRAYLRREWLGGGAEGRARGVDGTLGDHVDADDTGVSIRFSSFEIEIEKVKRDHAYSLKGMGNVNVSSQLLRLLSLPPNLLMQRLSRHCSLPHQASLSRVYYDGPSDTMSRGMLAQLH
jgi:hypothetical protein